MKMIITGALPPRSIITALTPHLEKNAPAYLARIKASIIHALPYETNSGQTPFQWLTADSHAQGLFINPVRIIFDQEGARLNTVMLTPDQYALASEHLTQILPELALTNHVNKSCWQSSANLTVPMITAEAIASGVIANWWPSDTLYRPLRQILSEMQTYWHSKSLETSTDFNSLWISPASLQSRCTPDTDHLVHHELDKAFQAQDWGYWLHQLSTLEHLFVKHKHWVFCGQSQILELRPKKPWQVFNQSWRTWW